MFNQQWLNLLIRLKYNKLNKMDYFLHFYKNQIKINNGKISI